MEFPCIDIFAGNRGEPAIYIYMCVNRGSNYREGENMGMIRRNV